MEIQTTELCRRAAVVWRILKVKVSRLSEKFQGWQVVGSSKASGSSGCSPKVALDRFATH